MLHSSGISPSARIALASLVVIGATLAWPGEAAAMLRGIGLQLDTRERFWLAAVSGFSLSTASAPGG